MGYKIYPHTCYNIERSIKCKQWTWCIIYLVIQGLILMFLALAIYSVTLISILAFMNGFCLNMLLATGPIE